jgi:GNAT superfamily N-acetyltransferase
MDITIDKGTLKDIDELEQLYDSLNDSLAKGINYPGWKKGIYPIRENAVNGIKSNCLYVARYDGKIVGSIILNHEPENAYHEATWRIEEEYNKIFVVHTLVVHPDYLHLGVGSKLMNFSFELGKEMHIKSIRLDVYQKNIPAIGLYERSGFQYIGMVDLGLGHYGLDWFCLYEKLL